jgi:hypothetical protein
MQKGQQSRSVSIARWLTIFVFIPVPSRGPSLGKRNQTDSPGHRHPLLIKHDHRQLVWRARRLDTSYTGGLRNWRQARADGPRW